MALRSSIASLWASKLLAVLLQLLLILLQLRLVVLQLGIGRLGQDQRGTGEQDGGENGGTAVHGRMLPKWTMVAVGQRIVAEMRSRLWQLRH